MVFRTRRAKTQAQQLGDHAEAIACDYLQQQGLHLRERNYRCKVGEIDLIMQDNDELIFVEVRYRKQGQYGSALESVTEFKQHKIARAADYYLASTRQADQFYCRFDIVAIDNETQQTIEWVKAAFTTNAL